MGAPQTSSALKKSRRRLLAVFGLWRPFLGPGLSVSQRPGPPPSRPAPGGRSGRAQGRGGEGRPRPALERTWGVIRVTGLGK